MSRRTHSQTLTLWANGEHVGRWTIPARGDMELQYDPGWLASARGRPISLSLPFNLNNEVLKGDHVAHLLEDAADDAFGHRFTQFGQRYHPRLVGHFESLLAVSAV